MIMRHSTDHNYQWNSFAPGLSEMLGLTGLANNHVPLPDTAIGKGKRARRPTVDLFSMFKNFGDVRARLTSICAVFQSLDVSMLLPLKRHHGQIKSEKRSCN